MTEEVPELPPETPAEEIIWHNVDRGVEDDQEVADLVQGIKAHALKGSRVLLERPNGPGHQRRHLADEERSRRRQSA